MLLSLRNNDENNLYNQIVSDVIKINNLNDELIKNMNQEKKTSKKPFHKHLL